ncbi:MAG: T9SS type A sorting domain-containing protein [Bacteroidales bacterium]|nr:T9SS type A sorting domain-containing protein [Bacteroidales bacterium]
MKSSILTFMFTAGFIFAFSFETQSQIFIEPGPDITVDDLVETLIGPGVLYDDVTYQGADIARGVFSNGGTTNIGIDAGIFLTSGSGYLIPGPNSSTSSSMANGMPGHPTLTMICAAPYTYDASILAFDFIPLNDTVKCNFVFGSEEYPEWVNAAFNDVFGFFISGPMPGGGVYAEKNIALVPGTDIPITINNVNGQSFSEYYVDNTNGATIEYDGFTTVITLWALVIPDEEYHFMIGVADAGDGIYDTGVLIEGTSFKSLGPPEFQSFKFTSENNPGLTTDIVGEITGNQILIKVPEGTDVSALVADFYVKGVEVFVEDQLQESGVSVNDFTEPLTYHLEGITGLDWTITLDFITGIESNYFENLVISSNPGSNELVIKNAEGANIIIMNMMGQVVKQLENVNQIVSISTNDLQKGVYFVKLCKENRQETRKIICR